MKNGTPKKNWQKEERQQIDKSRWPKRPVDGRCTVAKIY
jgi:hypothetical protein